MLSDIKLVDLSQPYYPGMAQWPTKCGFEHTVKQTYPESHLTDISCATGTGTHVDAPCHFIENGRAAHELELTELFCPLVVCDARKYTQENPNYVLSLELISAWEKANGPIPEKAMVCLLTGWDKYFSEPDKYAGTDSHGGLHFPGFSTESVEYLLTKNISGIGIDTLSLDTGVDLTFPVHKILLGANKYQIENLCNLDKLPQHGAMILTLPLKIQDAPESPARVVGMIG